MYFSEEAMLALPRRPSTSLGFAERRVPRGEQAGGRQESQIEKRRDARLSYREAVHYHVGETGQVGGTVAYDISENGLRLQLDDFVAINSRITLEIPLKDTKGIKIMTIHGWVAWVRQIRYSDRYQVGLEFSEPDLLIYEQIREALSRPPN